MVFRVASILHVAIPRPESETLINNIQAMV